MSADLIVYLRRSDMPTPAGWQQAIRDAGLPVQLDVDFDPDTLGGFLPCKLCGTEAGFEYYARPMSATEAQHVGAPLSADFSVILNTHSDLRDFVCAAIAAGALAWRSGGQLVDPQTGRSFESAEAVGWAAEQLARLSKKPGFISRLMRSLRGGN